MPSKSVNLTFFLNLFYKLFSYYFFHLFKTQPSSSSWLLYVLSAMKQWWFIINCNVGFSAHFSLFVLLNIFVCKVSMNFDESREIQQTRRCSVWKMNGWNLKTATTTSNAKRKRNWCIFPCHAMHLIRAWKQRIFCAVWLNVESQIRGQPFYCSIWTCENGGKSIWWLSPIKRQCEEHSRRWWWWFFKNSLKIRITSISSIRIDEFANRLSNQIRMTWQDKKPKRCEKRKTN